MAAEKNVTNKNYKRPFTPKPKKVSYANDGEPLISGTIERITYYNPEHNYCIAKARCENEKELITIVGTFASINVGEYLELNGEWITHKDFGRQFKVNSYKVTLPTSVFGIKKYLGSGLIKGIGPKTAERITNHFKEKTIEIIDRAPRTLLEIEGIGEWRLGQIIESWKMQSEIRSIMLFLQKYEISPSLAMKIYKKYGDSSVEILNNNPYKLAEDIDGVGFKSADRIALSMGIAETSVQRLQAAVIYVINEEISEGHVFVKTQRIFEKLKEIVDVTIEQFTTLINSMLREKMLLLRNEDNIYIEPLYISEARVAKNILNILNTPPKKIITEIDSIISRIEKSSKIKYSEIQLEAITRALTSKVMVLTGGPGTGKTTTIRGIIRAFKMLGFSVLQCAPTGRASKKMEESTGEISKTIHRLLEFTPGKSGFARDYNSPLECDVLICDESSMIDIILMNHLLKAVPPHSKIVFIGDINQLPSVGPGSVLKDFIHSGVVPTVELKTIFRQAEESLIITNSHKINSGEFPISPSKSNEILSDFYFIEKDEPPACAAIINRMVTERIPEKFGLNPIDDVQVLCPMYRGECGVINLNSALQNALNRSTLELAHKTRLFKLGDKVIQLENDYKKGVFNGDIGKVIDLKVQDRSLIVEFPLGQVEYEYNDLDSLDLAYAITIHKSQGSEYPAVIVPILTSHFIMLQRNLLYTAVTRARRLVILVGSKKAIYLALNNNKVLERNSNLANLLTNGDQNAPIEF
ncbi:MAG: ATP-dependent RecD-like DNA helicase [Candidatus Wallbacteria bacterium]